MKELNTIDCKNASAPINISMSKIMGPCVLKCDYNYKYGKYTPNVTNNKDYLFLNYSGKSDPVTYNNEKYNVLETRLYSPSLHKYNGKQADGEILIIHNGPGKNLIVSVPFTVGGKSDLGSVQLNNLVSEASTRTPNNGESVTISFGDFSLDNFLPDKKGFFSYTGTLPYTPCNGTYSYVVYSIQDSINISQANLKNLLKIIKSTKVKLHENVFFYNKKGANSSTSDDNIYIDCQPVDEEGNLYINESTGKTGGGFDIDVNFEQLEPFMFAIIGIIVASGILYTSRYMLKKFRDA